MKQRLRLSFSGGRFSATKADLIINKIGELADILICFANTGWEHDLRIEAQFGRVGKNKQGGVYVDEPRQLYRGNRSAGEIIATFKERSQCQKAS